MTIGTPVSLHRLKALHLDAVVPDIHNGGLEALRLGAEARAQDSSGVCRFGCIKLGHELLFARGQLLADGHQV